MSICFQDGQKLKGGGFQSANWIQQSVKTLLKSKKHHSDRMISKCRLLRFLVLCSSLMASVVNICEVMSGLRCILKKKLTNRSLLWVLQIEFHFKGERGAHTYWRLNLLKVREDWKRFMYSCPCILET